MSVPGRGTIRSVLSADRVAGFLSHRLAPVRGLARSYFVDARPMSNADAIWRAAERRPASRFDAFWLSLHSRQTPASLEKIASALRNEPYGHVIHSDLLSIGDARALLELLPRTALGAEYAQRIRYRCAIRALAPGEVWQQLTATAATLGESADDGEARLALWPLAEGAATHLSLAPRLLAGLAGDDFWLQFACIMAVGLAGLTDAIPLLVDIRLGDYEMIDELDGALRGMPAHTVLAELRARQQHPAISIFTPAVIGKFRTPAAEQLLCELLETEHDLWWRACIAETLCESCTTLGLPALKRLIPNVDYDGNAADLAWSLPALELMQAPSPAEVRRVEATIVEQLRTRGWSLSG